VSVWLEEWDRLAGPSALIDGITGLGLDDLPAAGDALTPARRMQVDCPSHLATEADETEAAWTAAQLVRSGVPLDRVLATIEAGGRARSAAGTRS
jgi:hypothetical protein